MNKLQCKLCNHGWLPRVKEVKECPKCKSRNWNKLDILKVCENLIGENKNA